MKKEDVDFELFGRFNSILSLNSLAWKLQSDTIEYKHSRVNSTKIQVMFIIFYIYWNITSDSALGNQLSATGLRVHYTNNVTTVTNNKLHLK